MFSLILAGLCFMLLHHQYYRYLDGKNPTQSLRHASSSTLFGNQRVVSSAGLALAYIAQMLFVTAIAIASSQIFWRNLRSRGHSISQIDALMKTRLNPFTFSAFPAAKASIAIPLLALLGVAMSLLSIFAPGAISVSFDYTRSGACTVQSLGNLTSLLTDSDASDYTTPIGTVLSTGTFIPPLNPCDGSDGMQCSYDLQFVGPGYSCEDVTASSDFAAFASWSPDPDGFNMTNVYNASIVPETSDLTIQLSVQTWDMKRSLFQAVNCTAVSRSYSVTVTHNSTSRIDVFESPILAPILSQPGVDLTQTPGNGNISFAQDYVVSGMTILVGSIGTKLQGIASTLDIEANQPSFMGSLPLYIGGLGSFLVDGNFTWRENMTIALEEYAQNLTLSLLSDQIFPFNNPGETSLLRNDTTECTYTFTAWKYTPWRLFVTYGIAALVTLLCVVGGISAIRANGVDESMDFSRFLRAVLNERLYQSSELDLNARLKADRNIEGTLAPDDS
ncbi:hypothetical protein SCHPADRAFT_675429 [Schizopora paradoxa]|uniref:Uncharacterized protein n=1 Tax=Schizopora paradoxa TaxID=27342 RepID=A0A0H2R4V4_9AGAM|nr:hypothetical protein SCHPADRAFT_675429 [Schizopora paradoxa]